MGDTVSEGTFHPPTTAGSRPSDPSPVVRAVPAPLRKLCGAIGTCCGCRHVDGRAELFSYVVLSWALYGAWRGLLDLYWVRPPSSGADAGGPLDTVQDISVILLLAIFLFIGGSHESALARDGPGEGAVMLLTMACASGASAGLTAALDGDPRLAVGSAALIACVSSIVARRTVPTSLPDSYPEILGALAVAPVTCISFVWGSSPFLMLVVLSLLLWEGADAPMHVDASRLALTAVIVQGIAQHGATTAL